MILCLISSESQLFVKKVCFKDPENSIHVDDAIADQDFRIQNSKSKLLYVPL